VVKQILIEKKEKQEERKTSRIENRWEA